MRRNRPDLIVPIHDRRQRRRYLTLKNFGWTTLAAGVLFVGISIYSEMRSTGPTNYGRLVAKEMPHVEQRPVEVVTETPTVDQEQTHADPMLVQAAAREQRGRRRSRLPPSSMFRPVPRPWPPARPTSSSSAAPRE